MNFSRHNQRIIDLPSERRPGEVFRHAMAARAMLERAWSAETAFQGIALTEDDVAPRGQCGVSSLWLARYLNRQGLDVSFTEGRIHLLSGEGDEHVWVEVRGIADEPLVVDLTSDQYQSELGTSVHMGMYANDYETVGRYTPDQQLSPDNVPRRKLLARYAILEQNIARLPRRYRLV